MTDLQDLLLDKLAGTEFGAGWQDGPFRVAAELIPGKPIKFTGKDEDATARNAIASRLGYPTILLEAAQGAVWVLASEDDRRALAMSVIRAIPPGSKSTPQPSEVYWFAATSVTRRAHALVCKAPRCGVMACLDAALAATTEKARERALDPFFRRRCPTYGRDLDEKIWISVRTPAIDRTIEAAGNCAGCYWSFEMKKAAARAARESARAAALVGGVEEAVGLCIELAQRLGMRATAPRESP